MFNIFNISFLISTAPSDKSTQIVYMFCCRFPLWAITGTNDSQPVKHSHFTHTHSAGSLAVSKWNTHSVAVYKWLGVCWCVSTLNKRQRKHAHLCIFIVMRVVSSLNTLLWQHSGTLKDWAMSNQKNHSRLFFAPVECMFTKFGI